MSINRRNPNMIAWYDSVSGFLSRIGVGDYNFESTSGSGFGNVALDTQKRAGLNVWHGNNATVSWDTNNRFYYKGNGYYTNLSDIKLVIKSTSFVFVIFSSAFIYKYAVFAVADLIIDDKSGSPATNTPIFTKVNPFDSMSAIKSIAANKAGTELTIIGVNGGTSSAQWPISMPYSDGGLADLYSWITYLGQIQPNAEEPQGYQWDSIIKYTVDLSADAVTAENCTSLISQTDQFLQHLYYATYTLASEGEVTVSNIVDADVSTGETPTPHYYTPHEIHINRNDVVSTESVSYSALHNEPVKTFVYYVNEAAVFETMESSIVGSYSLTGTSEIITTDNETTWAFDSGDGKVKRTAYSGTNGNNDSSSLVNNLNFSCGINSTRGNHAENTIYNLLRTTSNDQRAIVGLTDTQIVSVQTELTSVAVTQSLFSSVTGVNTYIQNMNVISVDKTETNDVDYQTRVVSEYMHNAAHTVFTLSFPAITDITDSFPYKQSDNIDNSYSTGTGIGDGAYTPTRTTPNGGSSSTTVTPSGSSDSLYFIIGISCSSSQNNDAGVILCAADKHGNMVYTLNNPLATQKETVIFKSGFTAEDAAKQAEVELVITEPADLKGVV